MAYQICYSKTSPCCVLPNCCINYSGANTCVTPGQCMRSLEIYGCTPDLTQGEFNDVCTQGIFMPVGCCCAWTVPAGVTCITVEMWGAGAGGSSSSCAGAGAMGGGGGTYVKRTIPVLPNDLMTLCAGAGGLMGQSGGSSNANAGWCCLALQGSCSYIRRNGIMCIDSWGGSQASPAYGPGVANPCGFIGTGDIGVSGCSNYTSDIRSQATLSAGGCSQSGVPKCTYSVGAATAFGGDQSSWGFQSFCGQYLRWNTACKNDYGVSGPGGNACSNSTAYNVGNNYYCAQNQCSVMCERGKAAPPGNFPGGGGAGGTPTCCAGLATAGGNGASGYIRIYY
jgi:hypothetical protein